MKNRQIDKRTKQIRIDVELHKFLKIEAAKEQMSIKDFIERILKDILGHTPIT